jgi:large subunit ribosomal protein L37e
MVGKGTPSFGKKNKKVHIICRRCGRRSYHIREKQCSACGFGKSPKIRKYKWQWKTVEGKRRK